MSPDWVSPPGDTIADALEELSISESHLMTALGMDDGEFGKLIAGEIELTMETAAILGRELDMDESFWISREACYRERAQSLARD